MPHQRPSRRLISFKTQERQMRTRNVGSTDLRQTQSPADAQR
ncbi:hypothetical protein SynSYN20_01179 [Synechococcus sp. SYN20]|nr:hypothetical protein SynSYN20_01179 [Synechococcus sp. SYN20]